MRIAFFSLHKGKQENEKMKNIESEHSCRGSFVDTAENEFEVSWIRGDNLGQMGLMRRASKKVWFGVCGFSHRVCRAAYNGPLDLVVIQDVIISDGKCEDARSCLAGQCPLNQTAESTIKKLLKIRDQKDLLAVQALTARRFCSLSDEKARPAQ